MTRSIVLPVLSALSVLIAPVAALAGDAAAGEAQWRQCRSCHMITSPAGDTIQRGGRVGPNLHGLPGRALGSVEGFRYSSDLVGLGQSGMVWTAELFAAYVADPTAFVREHTGNASARSPMNFQLRDGGADMFAYLESVSGN